MYVRTIRADITNTQNSGQPTVVTGHFGHNTLRYRCRTSESEPSDRLKVGTLRTHVIIPTRHSSACDSATVRLLTLTVVRAYNMCISMAS